MCDQIVKWIREKGTTGSVLLCIKKGCKMYLPGVLAGILAVGILCSCTRREQLVLDADRGIQSAEEAEGAGQDGLSDVDAAGGSAPAEQGQNAVDEVGQQMQSGESPIICVHVCGAVKTPGVYELAAGSRVFEAVREAGGFTAEADESYVNQAQRLTDGVKLVIPTVEQAENAAGAGESSAEQIGIVEQSAISQTERYGVSAGQSEDSSEAGSSSDGRLNINTASEAQLCEIPGIGATRAAAIVAYREQSGGFHSIEDIMKVSGIKEGTYAKIKDKIKVN